MKLLSLNVGLFEANNDALTEFIQQEKPDFISFQEVTKATDAEADRTFISKDPIDAVTPELKDSFFAPNWEMQTFEQRDFHGKEHFIFDLGGRAEFGNYIRSRHPITFGKNVFLQNDFTYVTDWSNWPQDDYKAVQVVDLDMFGKKLRILNYHGIWSREKLGSELTLQACKTIHSLATEVEYPAIICGDFNLFPDTKSMQVFYDDFESLVDTFTIKTTRPQSNELNDHTRNIVDYILVGKGIKVTSFDVIDSDVSDHLPLIIEFDI